MNDRLALLAAIREFPDDDLPRLAYADWAEEQGFLPLASSIRFALEERQPVLYTGGTVLLDSKGGTFGVPRGCTLAYCRGFIEVASCPLDDWQAWGPSLATEHPIQCVSLTDREPAWGYSGPAWCEGDHASACLPRALFVLLAGQHDGLHRKQYTSRKAALDDLSRAAILLARKQLLAPV